MTVGSCACGQGMFRGSYAVTTPLDEVLPGAVAAYHGPMKARATAPRVATTSGGPAAVGVLGK